MDTQELIGLSDEVVNLAKECAEHRSKCAKHKLAFDTILASKINEFYKVKKNIGYETSRLMLLSDATDEVREYDRQYHYHHSQYKGKEKIVEAIRDKINLEKFFGRI